MGTSSHKRFCKANQVRMPSPIMTTLKRASDEYFKKWCDAEKRIKELELEIEILKSSHP